MELEFQNYPKFTPEMKKTHKILIPNMAPVQFRILAAVMRQAGYTCELLENCGSQVSELGLKYVHNDTCYPALLVIGQFLDALGSGKYDLDHTALIITQTGGGCRASNYIHLLRKALEKADMAYIPVVSVNLSGLEKNPGFSLTLPFIRKAVFAMMYGDIIVNVANQVRPYEVEQGKTDAMIAHWSQKLVDGFQSGKGMSRGQMRALFDQICADFASIPVQGEPKIRVGVVGEIYVKFAPLGNNNLEQFLLSEGVEPVVPGLTDSDAHMAALRDYIKTLPQVERVELLPYHTLGMGKYAALGRPYSLSGVPEMDKARCAALEQQWFSSWNRRL